jgi:hypothetical protein
LNTSAAPRDRPARSAAIEAEAKEKAAQRDRQSALYRERERKAVYDIWKDAKADTGAR